MISQDDIEAFADANEPALQAADEFVRRSEKGIPTDRWYDGQEGLREIARGYKAQRAMFNMVADAFLAILAEKQDAGRLFTSHSKYAQKEE